MKFEGGDYTTPDSWNIIDFKHLCHFCEREWKKIFKEFMQEKKKKIKRGMTI